MSLWKSSSTSTSTSSSTSSSTSTNTSSSTSTNTSSSTSTSTSINTISTIMWGTLVQEAKFIYIHDNFVQVTHFCTDVNN